MSEMAESELARLLEQAKLQVNVGARYRHYRGMEYHVVSVALREENLEPCVVYQAEYGDKVVWVRPVSSWLEQVDIDGQKVPRFTQI